MVVKSVKLYSNAYRLCMYFMKIIIEPRLQLKKVVVHFSLYIQIYIYI